MNYKFYTTTEKAWDAMLASVRAAKHSVYFESYIFVHDTEGTHNFVEALCEKALAGVEVVVVIDRWGSWYLGESQEKSLRDAGVDLVYYSDFFRRIHRKSLIVDRKVAFLGGVNVSKQYQTWLDLHVRLTEPAFVEALLKSFWRSYRASGGKKKENEPVELPTLRKRAHLWLLDHRPKLGTSTLKHYYQEKMSEAEESIIIVTPYFVPHRWFIDAARSAMNRGVDVSVIVPRHTDPAIMSIPNIVSATALSREGVHFFFTRAMNHAKALLVDDKVGLVGSQNIDALSFDYNAEVGVSFTEPNMIRDLKLIIERWKRDADPFSPQELKRKWYQPFVEFLVFLLQPVL